MKKCLLFMSLICLTFVFKASAEESINTLKSTCLMAVINSGSEINDEIRGACDQMSSALDVDIIVKIGQLVPLNSSLIKSSSDIPSIIEYGCITNKIEQYQEKLDTEMIVNCINQ